MYHKHYPSRQSGVLMIEVLITILVTTLGLLGIAALFARSQQMGDEAYQRYQALDIAHQLAEVLSVNRPESLLNAASNYVVITAASLPGDPAFSVPDASVASLDLLGFHNALIGAQKTQGGLNVAALVAARGCVDFLGTVGSPTDPPRYRVSVAWQGREGSAATVAGVSACGTGLYSAENLRRVVSLEVQVL